MTSRERVLCAVNHKEADRVPIDCGAMRSTGLSAVSFNKLKKYLGLNDPCLLYDFVQQLAYPRDALRERFHVDSMDVGEAFVGDISKEWKPWTLPDGTDCLIPNYIDARRDPKDGTIYLYDASGVCVGKQPVGSHYVDQTYFPYGDLDSIPEVLNESEYSHTLWNTPTLPFHLDLVNSDADFETFVSTIKALRKSTDRALMIAVGQSYFECCGFIRTPVNFMYDLYDDRPGVERMMDTLEDQYMAKLDRILSSVAEDVDIVQFGDDLGTQRSTFLSPDLIKEVFVPRYKKMWDYVHSKGKKVFMHSCGSISAILPHLIDAGLDIINPVQTTASHMDPVMLKREFGKDLCFWGGGCEVQGVLTTGTPEQVKDQVKRRIEILGKDGGFVFNQIHNVLGNVPVENIIAMYDAAYEFGAYV